MNKFITISVLAAISTSAFVFTHCDRGQTKVVATVGSEKITLKDFKERYRKYLEFSSTNDNVLTRKLILDNLINEKLIFQDIARRGLDTDEVSRRRLKEIRLQALIDRYARGISADTITVSERELWQAFRAYTTKVNARYLYAKTEEEASALKKQLEEGETFESLAKEIFEDPGLANNGGNLGYFGWGDMEPALEEVAFTLPVGQLSDPIHLRMGYAILKVEDRFRNPLVPQYNYAKIKENLEHALFHKKAERVVSAALDNIVENLAPQFNESTVHLLFQNWHYLVSSTIPGNLTEHDRRLENLESLHLVRFQNNSWSVKTFLKKLKETTERQRKRVTSEKEVKNMSIGLMARQILLDRAQKTGFENDPTVLQQIARVREEYFLKRWRHTVQDTVGQNDWDEPLLREHFEQQRNQYQFPPQVNVAEILVNSEAEAEEMVRRLKKGEKFADLARKYSLRLWAAKRGGELGFSTEADFGILGKRFFLSSIGQIIGPERVDPYYGVFKVLAKRDARHKSFEEAKEEMIQELAFTRKREVFAKAIEELRNRITVTTNDDLLAHIALE